MLDTVDKAPVTTETSPRRHEAITAKDLTPEEVKKYKDCMSGLVYKVGLPFAAVAHVLSSWKAKPDAQSTTLRSQIIVKKTFLFFGNMLLGTFLFAPLCYHTLYEMRMNLEKRKKAEAPDLPPTEGTQTTRMPDDYTYPTDLTSTLNEAESTFSRDFSSSKVLEREEPVVSPSSTTYRDLRSKHRSSFESPVRESLPSQIPSDTHSKPIADEAQFVEKEPRKFVRRNKYGDEIE